MSRGDTRHAYLYPEAGQGYLFHDTEGIADGRRVHKALWRLSAMYPDALHAFIVRVDKNTVMGSFNTNSFPKPVRVYPNRWDSSDKGYEWLTKNRPEGWLIENVRRPDARVTGLNYDDVYEQCPQLERMTGNCPCPRLKEGTCFADTVFRELPALEGALVDFGQLPPEMHTTVSYKEVDGFEYVPGLYTVEGAFVPAMRPWDNYDFGLVKDRREEFKDRGVRHKHRKEYRKEFCANCIFGKGSADAPTDCGNMASCRELPVTKEIAEKALEEWMRHATPMASGSEGFTRSQIMYLAEMTGKQFSTRAFVKTGTSMACFAGFTSTTFFGDNLAYRIVPMTGDLTRSEVYYSYEDMLKSLPGLKEEVGYPYVTEWSLIVQAALATQRYVPRAHDEKPMKLHYLKADYYNIEVYGTQGRRSVECVTISQANWHKRIYEMLWPGYQTLAHMLADTPQMHPTISAKKPVALNPIANR